MNKQKKKRKAEAEAEAKIDLERGDRGSIDSKTSSTAQKGLSKTTSREAKQEEQGFRRLLITASEQLEVAGVRTESLYNSTP